MNAGREFPDLLNKEFKILFRDFQKFPLRCCAIMRERKALFTCFFEGDNRQHRFQELAIAQNNAIERHTIGLSRLRALARARRVRRRSPAPEFG